MQMATVIVNTCLDVVMHHSAVVIMSCYMYNTYNRVLLSQTNGLDCLVCVLVSVCLGLSFALNITHLLMLLVCEEQCEYGLGCWGKDGWGLTCCT